MRAIYLQYDSPSVKIFTLRRDILSRKYMINPIFAVAGTFF